MRGILFIIVGGIEIQIIGQNEGICVKDKRLLTLIIMCVLILGGCGRFSMSESQNRFTKSEISFPDDYEEIGNEIPLWVEEKDSVGSSFYAVTLEDKEDFDLYAKEVFKNLSDSEWTQEQSDNVYLGQGIYSIPFDGDRNKEHTATILHYPIILNDTIVSMMMIYQSEDEFDMQMSPLFANEFNMLRALTDADNPLYLGISNNNKLGIVKNDYYILDINHVEYKEPKLSNVSLEGLTGIKVVDVMEKLSDERTAQVDDWNISILSHHLSPNCSLHRVFVNYWVQFHRLLKQERYGLHVA